MAKIKLQPEASSSNVFTIATPAGSADRVITLPDATATIATTTDVAARLPSIVDGGNATAITITSAEKIGIGTTAPDTELHVHGTGTLLSSDSYFVAQIQTDRNDNGSSDDAILQFVNGSGKTVKGEIRWDESSNTFELGHGDNANHIVIDSTGAVTMPLQPAFSVASNVTQSNITIGQETTVVYGTEVFDQNSDFTSNTFTAPVTGKYQLNATTRLNSVFAGSQYFMYRIRTSNREYKSIFDPDFGQDAVYWSTSFSVLADMDAGDTAIVSVIQNNGDAQTDIQGNTQYTYFTGYLVA